MLFRILGAKDFAVVVKLGRELHHRAPFCFVLLVCVCLSCRPRVPKWREPNRRAAVNQLNLCRLRQRSARCRHSNQGGRAGGFQEALSALTASSVEARRPLAPRPRSLRSERDAMAPIVCPCPREGFLSTGSANDGCGAKEIMGGGSTLSRALHPEQQCEP